VLVAVVEAVEPHAASEADRPVLVEMAVSDGGLAREGTSRRRRSGAERATETSNCTRQPGSSLRPLPCGPKCPQVSLPPHGPSSGDLTSIDSLLQAACKEIATAAS
jgi:hypothetical protein